VDVAFIRAPIVERVGENVQILSQLPDGAVVAVREGNLLATSFHPELTGDSRVHEYFLGMISKTH
jgi:5'-phosphate synthase pdxT subunit